ncbi:hypothetical protein Agub_g219, partial [Astrephomene gubernaculifera]
AGTSGARLEELQHWPLLPALGSRSGCGVLLPVRHSRLLFCLPPSAPAGKEAKGPSGGGGGGGVSGGGAAAPEVSGAAAAAGPVPALDDLAPSLPAPWNWLSPALHGIGCPLLDPRFTSVVSRHCGPHPEDLPPRSLAEAAAVAATGASPASLTRGSAATAAAAACAALVSRMRLCDAAVGGSLPVRCEAAWDDRTRAAVLGLLAETTPTTLDPADLIFLRRLPIYPTHAGGYTALEGPLAPPPPPPSVGSAAADVPAAAGAPATTGGTGGGGAGGAGGAGGGIAVEGGAVVCSSELLQLVPGLAASLPSSVPQRLLLPQPGASRLYSLLNISSLTPATFLASIALPHLPALPDTLQASLLTYLQTNWTRLRSEEGLLAALRDTAFVLTADGTTKRPGELYDPDQPLFAAAFLGCPVFPREQFAFPAWLAVLRDVGLQATVTPAAFLAAAEAVAARATALHMTLPYEGIPEEGASLEDPFLSGGAPEVPPPVAAARARLLQAADMLVSHLTSSASSSSSSLLAAVGAAGRGAAAGGAGGGAGQSLAGAGREWWGSLAKVAFVPAQLGLPGSRRARQVLTRYSDAAAAADWPLVWSVLPVVAAERQPAAGLGQGQLRLRSPPPFAAMLAHLRRVGADCGEEALGGWPASAGSVEEAFKAVLQYLDREGVAGGKAAQLRDVAFVPVARGTLLAPPRRLYVRLKEDLAPFAFEVPPSLASFTPLLKSLGAQDEPRAQDLLDSLHALAASAGGAPLSPNQRHAVLRLLALLAGPTAGGAAGVGAAAGGAGVVAAGGAGGMGGVGRSAADLAYLNAARRERRLLVLAADGRLVPAHTAVSVGEGGGGGGGSSAGRLLGRLDPRALTLAHPLLPEGVAGWLGCMRLGEVAEERLDPGHCLEPVEQIQGLTLRDARALLASPAFISACHALLRTHAPLLRGLTATASSLTRGSLHELAATLRSAASRLTFVRSLRTTAVLRSSGAPLSPDAEASRAVFDFVESSPTPTSAHPSAAPQHTASSLGRIYIAEPPSHLPVSWLLSSVVSRVLGSPVVLPLQPLFTTPPAELPQLQPVLLPGGFDAGMETAAQAGTPGAPLLPADVALLQLKPLRRYVAGEVVAYQRTAEMTTTAAAEGGGVAAAAAAAAAERRAAGGDAVASGSNSSSSSSSSSSTSSTSMCYGRVAAHCAASEGAGVHRVQVEVEPGVVRQLLSTQVFCFRSPSGEAAAQDTAAAVATSPAMPAPTTATMPSGGGSQTSPAAASTPSSTTATATAPHAAAAAAVDAAGGPVRASEMVAAVRDVLAAAGLPLEAGAGQLMGRVAALQEELEAAQEQLAQAKREAASSAADAESARGAWQCKICFSRDVDAAFTGCGHLICARCAAASGSSRCPVCRKPSQQLLRLYRA